MLDALRRPVPFRLLVAGVAAAALLVALYCVGYTWLAGRPETFAEALGWAIVNICPWLVAIEAGKRAAGWPVALLILLGTGITSVLLGLALGIGDGNLGFEFWRRVPPLVAVGALVSLLRSGAGRKRANNTDIPLLPRQIDWVQAAGNYIELRSGGRTVLHRLPISEAERSLSAHGFVRIHRSTLVRRDRIARVRPQDVVLHDGTQLRVGKRYRSQITR